MPIREGDTEREFLDKLKNPTKPINNTETSEAMSDYLRKMDNGELKSEETIKKKAAAKKKEEEDKQYKLFCPHCKRLSLKRTPYGTYDCIHCGLSTTTPLRMSE